MKDGHDIEKYEHEHLENVKNEANKQNESNLKLLFQRLFNKKSNKIDVNETAYSIKVTENGI